jgi:hypothetical protein
MIFREPQNDYPCPTCGAGAFEIKTNERCEPIWYACALGHRTQIKKRWWRKQSIRRHVA